MKNSANNAAAPIPFEWRSQWATDLSMPLVDKQHGSDGRLFVFKLGSEWYGLDPSLVEAVTPQLVIHGLPGRSGLIAGVVNFRGKILLNVDLAHLLKVSKKNTDSTLSSVILNFNGWRLSFFSGKIEGIHLFPSTEMLPLPTTIHESTMHHSSALLNWDEKSLIVLNSDALEKSLRREVK